MRVREKRVESGARAKGRKGAFNETTTWYSKFTWELILFPLVSLKLCELFVK